MSCETGFGQFTTIESVAKALNMAINRTSKPWATFYFHDLDKAEHQTWNLYRNESAMSLPDHPPGSLNIYLDLDWNEGDIRNLLANFVSRRGVQTYEALLEEIKQEKELTLGT